MSEEMDKAGAEFLRAMTDALRDVKAATFAEAPDALRQMVEREIFLNRSSAITLFAFAAAMILAAAWLNKHRKRANDKVRAYREAAGEHYYGCGAQDEAGFIEFVQVLAAVIALILVIVGTLNLRNAYLVEMAPKAWLAEHLLMWTR